MRRDDILRRLQEQPFHPFNLRLSSGKVHLVRHPEMALVGGSSMVIGFPRAEDSGLGDIDDYMVVSLSHVEQIDPVSILPPPPSKTPLNDDND